jgi:glycosyltransferase involved in cell wall biosynthesis
MRSKSQTTVKILHIITSLNPAHGGPMQGLRNYLPEIYKRGYRNEVVCLDDPNESFVGKDVFITHALGPSRRPWSYTKRLLPWLKENLQRFDAVLIHGLWQYHGYAVHKAIHWMKRQGMETVPSVFVMPHGMLDPYFQKAPERRLKAVRNIFYWNLIEEKIVRKASAMLFTCEEELRLARETFDIYRPKREINIGYGIAEPPAFTPKMAEAFAKHCPEAKGQPFLLFLSRIHPKKGVDLLIKAYAEVFKPQALHSETKEIAAQPNLLIAGPGLETPYGKKLQELVNNLGLTEKVFFIGMLTGDVKWGAFYSSDAFVLSSHQENFGIAVAEALACSRPVLISDQINIWREIKEAGAGLVAEDTLRGTTSLVQQWASLTPEQRNRMEKSARECYEKNFAVAPAAKKLMQVVLKLITEKKAWHEEST